MGSRLLVNGGMIGVLFPKGRVLVFALRDELVSHDIDKWDTCRATDAGQDDLHLLKHLCSGGCVKGYGNVVRLLVHRSPGIFKTLLHPEQLGWEICSESNFGPFKLWNFHQNSILLIVKFVPAYS
jgi:hypothetical protein